MAGKQKLCEKCEGHCLQNKGYLGIKPDKFPQYKWLCNECVTKLNSNGTGHMNFLEERFRAEGWMGDKL